ncbi:hypothetical protein AX774_g1691 [Zancudomyces culisetae]|uniref:Exocyst complex component Sec8 N-terminal domain-containing protein n=1 Tax=Zancudomyces culisetae TaxID=1213189 RepID=A0A1R1PUY3_ZANCU|nr:hypothetical protein AX774_g1691 [Zancudomyces culisetae]|eukprot:OMH84784.1 hypothetical protein AX774_g1691 [Zancudomyces culisetae]
MLDTSSLGKSHDTFQIYHKRLNATLEGIADEYYGGFNNSILTFSGLHGRISQEYVDGAAEGAGPAVCQEQAAGRVGEPAESNHRSIQTSGGNRGEYLEKEVFDGCQSVGAGQYVFV